MVYMKTFLHIYSQICQISFSLVWIALCHMIISSLKPYGCLYQIFAFLRGSVVLSARFVKILKGWSDSRGRDNRSREARQPGDRRRKSTLPTYFLPCQSGVEYIAKGVRPPSKSSPGGTNSLFTIIWVIRCHCKLTIKNLNSTATINDDLFRVERISVPLKT